MEKNNYPEIDSRKLVQQVREELLVKYPSRKVEIETAIKKRSRLYN